MSEHTINIPQVLAVLLISFFALRWFFSHSSSSAGGNPASPDSTAAGRANPAHVDQVAQMFPQLSRREIAWDLQRNGGNVAATTERVLSGRALDTPPVSFQPLPSQSSPSAGLGGRGGSTTAASRKPAHTDLITRYSLASKLNSVAPSAGGAEGKLAWSSNKSERQQILQRRREEMILAARRKLEEKDRAAAVGGKQS